MAVRRQRTTGTCKRGNRDKHWYTRLTSFRTWEAKGVAALQLPTAAPLGASGTTASRSGNLGAQATLRPWAQAAVQRAPHSSPLLGAPPQTQWPGSWLCAPAVCAASPPSPGPTCNSRAARHPMLQSGRGMAHPAGCWSTTCNRLAGAGCSKRYAGPRCSCPSAPAEPLHVGAAPHLYRTASTPA